MQCKVSQLTIKHSTKITILYKIPYKVLHIAEASNAAHENAISLKFRAASAPSPAIAANKKENWIYKTRQYGLRMFQCKY